ncbi:MAG: ferritin-like domain-containing protein [Alphaproteobacteria bacterium]|nr:ferritin-like domain-containing protein [Alphaproteobacteria bacterium]
MRARIARLLFWRKPDERLKEFAETEAFGARDLARAAERAEDPWVRRQLIRHAQDEVRHAKLLDEDMGRPDAVGLGAAMIGETPAADGVDIEQMGELPFIAFVHVAEKRAVEEFKLHREALGERGEVFDSILQDEKRHVAWTGHALDRYEKAGRGDEVRQAVRRMQRQRWWGMWLAFARRLSWVVSAVMLSVVYYVLMGPFALLAGRWRGGWVESRRTGLERQF